LQTRTECDEVVLDVEDHGTGIAPEHLTHVFDHFYKADASRGRDGSGAGMGLAIAKRVMELHGGSIAVESEVGTGTIFHLRFPLAKAT
jgi:signal transduction histidine kinase